MTTKMLLAEHNVCWPGQTPMGSSMSMSEVSEIEQPLGLVGSEGSERRGRFISLVSSIGGRDRRDLVGGGPRFF